MYFRCQDVSESTASWIPERTLAILLPNYDAMRDISLDDLREGIGELHLESYKI